VANRGNIAAVRDDRWNARFAFALGVTGAHAPPGVRTPPRGSERRPKVPARDLSLSLPLGGVPCVIVTHAQLRDLPLDSRDAFVLSLVDGTLTVESIVDVTGMPEDEAMEILGRLLDLGAVGMHPPSSDF
jgi:hypothetical protein